MAFPILVQVLSGRTFTLDVEAGDFIKSVKTKIQDKEGVRPYQQKLVHDIAELEDCRTLSNYSSQQGSTLNLIVLPSFWIEIQLKQHILNFEVTEQCTPDDIKQLIFGTVGSLSFLAPDLRPRRQVLSFQMEEYDDFTPFCLGTLAGHGVRQAQDIHRMYCELSAEVLSSSDEGEEEEEEEEEEVTPVTGVA